MVVMLFVRPRGWLYLALSRHTSIKGLAFLSSPRSLFPFRHCFFFLFFIFAIQALPLSFWPVRTSLLVAFLTRIRIILRQVFYRVKINFFLSFLFREIRIFFCYKNVTTNLGAECKNKISFWGEMKRSIEKKRNFLLVFFFFLEHSHIHSIRLR